MRTRLSLPQNTVSLQKTLNRIPVVKLVAIGPAASEAAALMIKEGIEGVGFVHYGNSTVSQDVVKRDLLDAHLVIVIGTNNETELFNKVGRISRKINLLTLGIGITSNQSSMVDSGVFNTLFQTSIEKLAASNQSTTDFLNLACSGLGEVLGYKQRLTIGFNDIEDVFLPQGKTAIGVGIGYGIDRVLNAVRNALTQLALAEVDLSTAKAALFILKANSAITHKEVKLAFASIYNRDGERYYDFSPPISDEASCIGSVVEGGNFDEAMRVTIFLTGMS